ncbi:hypothetical protein [Kutzneria kofuensis]|uniref:Uncharacterized protein n=1 Tax=Kutzneria kofuensis TaxID=103725 RepID=A0A7W9KQN8_9PSEU|nr:hypothetical protein [Kutzneria kofuensis]MBB5896957.1 hypothetical protein [Kutzneria kofuensis]
MSTRRFPPIDAKPAGTGTGPAVGSDAIHIVPQDHQGAGGYGVICILTMLPPGPAVGLPTPAVNMSIP